MQAYFCDLSPSRLLKVKMESRELAYYLVYFSLSLTPISGGKTPNEGGSFELSTALSRVILVNNLANARLIKGSDDFANHIAPFP